MGTQIHSYPVLIGPHRNSVQVDTGRTASLFFMGNEMLKLCTKLFTSMNKQPIATTLAPRDQRPLSSATTQQKHRRHLKVLGSRD